MKLWKVDQSDDGDLEREALQKSREKEIFKGRYDQHGWLNRMGEDQRKGYGISN